MNFNSFQFLFIFLPFVLIPFYFFVRKLSLLSVLGALSGLSLLFYAWSNWKLLLVLFPAIIGNFLLGQLIQNNRTRPRLILGVGLNIGLLAVFKYFNFFYENVSMILGWQYNSIKIIMPVAISFYTFQQIAFLVDCYRGVIIEKNIIRYIFFITFFPQLNQGPIVRHHELVPQLEKSKILHFDASNFSIGLMLLSMGLGKKILIADQCAVWANAAFADPQQVGFLGAWIGALSYTMQIYFDFSGYTDMAIGIGYFFNIRLPSNFDSPYKATSFVDFWRRWHITLSHFLRDYLYIPLGGNRVGRIRQTINIMITMLLGGLWHGANWTFVIWGGFHGFFIALTHLWRRSGLQVPSFVARGLTFFGIMFGWVIFRASDVEQALCMFSQMLNFKDNYPITKNTAVGFESLVWLLGLFIFVNVAPNSLEFANRKKMTSRYAWFFAIIFFMSLLGMYNGNFKIIQNQFIYANF